MTSRNKIIFCTLALIILVISLQFKNTGKAAVTNAVEVTYVASDDDFSNPERGFMKQSSIYPDQTFDPAKVRVLNPADSVVWIYFRLDNYRDPNDRVPGPKLNENDYQCQPIDATGLSRINQTFQTAREKGLKLVYRFIYNWGPGSTTNPVEANPDVPIKCVRQHLTQLTDIIRNNIDVTVALQAGFVGHWGEWHSSKYLQDLAVRREIVDTLLSILPNERMLQIRFPNFKEIFYQGPLNETTAFSQTAGSRVGHHNDCFLRDADDTTYRSKRAEYTSTYCAGLSGQAEIDCWKNFVAQEGRFTPIGGESCQYNPPRTDCPNSLAELELLHWSFINNGYRPEVVNPQSGSWATQGCLPEIRRRLGYRIELKDTSIPPQVARGGTLNLQINLKNIGFASMFNPRPVFAVLQNTSNRYEILLTNIDPRRWEAGLEQTISVNVTIQANVVPGIYKLGLWLPDESANLRNLPAYAVRFANTNVWEATTGLNILTSNLEVVSSSILPSSTPTPQVIIKQLLGNWLGSALDLNGDTKVNSLDVWKII